MVDITPIGEMRQCTDDGRVEGFDEWQHMRNFTWLKEILHTTLYLILTHAESSDLFLNYEVFDIKNAETFIPMLE